MTPHKHPFRRSVLSFMLLMAMSIGVMGTGFAAAYIHTAKSVGNDLSIQDWNNMGFLLGGNEVDGTTSIHSNGTGNWGFGTSEGTDTITTAGGITLSAGDLTVGTTSLAEATSITDSGAYITGYSNTSSGLTAATVQAALDEIVNGGILPAGANTNTLRSDGTDWLVATNLTNDGTDVGVTGELDVTGGFTDANATTAITLGDAGNTSLDIGSSIVGGINAVHTNTLTNTTAINSVKTELDTTQTGAGLNADGTLPAWGGAILSSETSLKAGIDALDTAIGNLSGGMQLTDDDTTDNATVIPDTTCNLGAVGTMVYAEDGTKGEFFGCVIYDTGLYSWVRLSIYTQ